MTLQEQIMIAVSKLPTKQLEDMLRFLHSDDNKNAPDGTRLWSNAICDEIETRLYWEEVKMMDEMAEQFAYERRIES